MTKPSKPSSKLVYVHGTNGSGKSTLARAVIAAAGGVTGLTVLVGAPKAIYTRTAAGLVLVGKYGNACGGVDGLQPYASIHDIVQSNIGRTIFAEGLVTPGLETCQKLAEYVHGNAVWVFLDTPIDACIANVLKRRGRKGTTKPYDPANLLRKRESSASWARRLTEAGLDVRILTSWSSAYLLCLDELGLPVPDVDQLI